MGRKPPEKSWKIEPTPILEVCLARTGQNSLPPHRMLWGEFLIQICHIPGQLQKLSKHGEKPGQEFFISRSILLTQIFAKIMMTSHRYPQHVSDTRFVDEVR
jgi:hypothetical protein